MQNRIVTYVNNKYVINNIQDFKNAIREVLQLCVLSGLERGGFFKEVVFYGGTSLRILRGLDRFSEDLDFILKKFNSNFNLNKYTSYMLNELRSLNIDAECEIKDKSINTSVITAYLKIKLQSLLDMFDYNFQNEKNEVVNIKIDLETNAFLGGVEEFKKIKFPFFSTIRTFDMPTLFSSKLLAILGRDWKNRVKGRDYYDYLFYISNDIKINLDFLNRGLIKFKKIEKEASFDEIKQMLYEKFSNVDFDLAKKDVKPFIKNEKELDSFNKQFFLDTINLLKV